MTAPNRLLLVAVSGILLIVALRKWLVSLIFSRSTLLSNIPGPRSKSWLKGNMGELFDRTNGPNFHKDIITSYDRIAKVYGFLGDEQLYVSDPLALQSIIVKDQDVYEETKVFIDNNKIIFGEGLVATIGEHHKKQRKLVTPAFSVQRLRRLVPTFYNVANRLRSALLNAVEQSDETKIGATVDMAEWMSRVAIESIGCAGLGYSLDPLDSPATNPYTKTVRELIPALFSIALLRLLTPSVLKLGPPGFRRFLLDLVPIKAVQTVKHMSDVMDRTCREILARKRSLRNNEIDDRSQQSGVDVQIDGDGKDIMSILLDSNDVAGESEKLSDAELLGQMNVLIFGAQDTTSSALSRVLQVLSRPEKTALQTALREEIVRAAEERDSNELNYEDIMDRLPLLDAVLKETLRLYPPVPFVRRVSTRAAILPLSRPIRLTNGTYTSSIPVPKGTTIWISIMGANTSTDVWGADADVWDHTRWLNPSPLESELESAHRRDQGGPKIMITDEEGRTRAAQDAGGDDTRETGLKLFWWKAEEGEVGKRTNLAVTQPARARLPGVFAGMLTFFGGGRSCVGYRFALLEMKIIISTLLSTFTFSESTENEIVWRLSQIVSPSYINKKARAEDGDAKKMQVSEKQGLPIRVASLREDSKVHSEVKV